MRIPAARPSHQPPPLHRLSILLLVLSLSAITIASAQPIVVEAPDEAQIHFALGVPSAPPAAIDPATQRGVTPNLMRHRLGIAATAEPSIEPMQAERIVRQAYQRVERALRAAGHQIMLDLVEVRTIPEAEFPRHRFADLLSSPGEHELSVVRGTYFTEDASWATFELEWVPARDVPAEVLTQRKSFDVIEGLQDAAEHDIRFARHHIEAVSTFDVEIAFDGIDRRYRAAFFWFRQDGRLAFSPQDNMIRNLRTPLLEARKIVPVKDFVPRRESVAVPLDLLLQQEVDDLQHETRCVDGVAQDHFRNRLSTADSFEHESGQHQGAMRLAAQCDTTTDCRSSCSPYFADKTCSDIGERSTTRSHAPYMDFVLNGDEQIGTSSRCGGAFGCAFESCWSLTCKGVSFSVSGSGASVSVKATGNYFFEASFSDAVACPKATPVDTTDGTLGSDPAPIPYPDCDYACTPILLDLDRDGFRLTGLSEPVLFDLDADGELERLAWTAEGSDEAFVVLDRNGDGRINDGRELFGASAPQPPSEDPNGFRALAVFDAPAQGGNGDGLITSADAVFVDLRLWQDRNRDGTATPDELLALSEAGILGIDLDYVLSRRRDRHGNLFRWAAHVLYDTGSPLSAVDVILVSGAGF